MQHHMVYVTMLSNRSAVAIVTHPMYASKFLVEVRPHCFELSC